MKTAIIMLGLLIVVCIGCVPAKEVIYVQNRTNHTVFVQNHTIEPCPEVKCEDKEITITRACNETSSKRDMQTELQIGRLVSELNYHRNFTAKFLGNTTYLTLERNLTKCYAERHTAQDQLERIEIIIEE